MFSLRRVKYIYEVCSGQFPYGRVYVSLVVAEIFIDILLGSICPWCLQFNNENIFLMCRHRNYFSMGQPIGEVFFVAFVDIWYLCFVSAGHLKLFPKTFKFISKHQSFQFYSKKLFKSCEIQWAVIEAKCDRTFSVLHWIYWLMHSHLSITKPDILFII